MDKELLMRTVKIVATEAIRRINSFRELNDQYEECELHTIRMMDEKLEILRIIFTSNISMYTIKELEGCLRYAVKTCQFVDREEKFIKEADMWDESFKRKEMNV